MKSSGVARLAASLAVMTALVMPTPSAAAEAPTVVPGFPLIGTVAVAGGVTDVAASPVADVVFATARDRIIVMDALTRSIANETALAPASMITGLVAPAWFDGVYVSAVVPGRRVFEVSREPLRIVRSFDVFGIDVLAAHPTQPLLYGHNVLGHVDVISAISGRPLSRITLPALAVPWGNAMVVSPDGRYLVLSVGNDVLTIDIGAGQVIARIESAYPKPDVALSPDGTSVFVSGGAAGTLVSRYDTATLRPVATVPAFQPTKGMYVAGRELAITDRYLLASSGSDRSRVSVVDLGTNRVVGSTLMAGQVGRFAVNPGNAMAVDRSGGMVWVTGQDGVQILNLKPAVPGPVLVRTRSAKTSIAVRWPSVPAAEQQLVTVTAFPGRAACSSDTDSCVISGLKPGQAYRLQVVATNMAGQGPVMTTRVRTKR